MRISDQGAVTIQQTLAVNGNVTLGNATSDSHTINGSLSVAAGANNVTIDAGTIDLNIGSIVKVAIGSSILLNDDVAIGDGVAVVSLDVKGGAGVRDGLSTDYIAAYDGASNIYIEPASTNNEVVLESDRVYIGDPLIAGDKATLWIKGAIHNTREFVAPQITADQNNYNPTASSIQWDASNSSILYVNSDAARSITGLANSTGWVGRHVWMYNTGSFNITLVHQSASSSAGNRFHGVNSANITLQPKQGVHLYLSAQMSNEWIVLA
jgi:acetyltransferase-like isoleucine patch superfamily enzyme